MAETATLARPGGAPAQRGTGWVRRWWSLLLLAVVLGAALVVGSGVTRSGPLTPAQRAAALEAQLKCPSCEDVSVADSAAPTAVAVRQQVTRMIAEGQSDAQIDRSLVARYGETILLRPPVSGLSALVWVVPAVVGGAAILALGIFFWRRSRSFGRLRAGTGP